jgi:adenylosuccinate synthase
LFAAWLADQSQLDKGVVVHTTNAAPNAGHTTEWSYPATDVSDERVYKLVLYHLPTGGVWRDELCYINAGAVVDIGVLAKELQHVHHVMEFPPNVLVHPSAVILQPEDRDDERGPNSAMHSISSTQKGVGAAIARKVRRTADLMNKFRTYAIDTPIRLERLDLNRHLAAGRALSIEVPQGMSLGLNHGGFYPYCTSREVSIAQAMSDAGVHPRHLGPVALTMRTFPIRVGSLPGSTSGGHYHDQREIDWTELPVSEPEITTVTKRPRRVFTWSREQYRDALRKAHPSVVFLNFVNYFKSAREFDSHMADMESDHDLTGIRPQIVYGLGPRVSDIMTLPSMARNLLTVLVERRLGKTG